MNKSLVCHLLYSVSSILFLFMDFMSDDVGIEDINLMNEVPLQVTPLVKKNRARTGNYTAKYMLEFEFEFEFAFQNVSFKIWLHCMCLTHLKFKYLWAEMENLCA